MSNPPWDSIPLLALKCILEHLNEKQALAAMSTCRHWRSAMLMYEGNRELLKLHVNQFEKSKLLARIYKKHTRKLHIYIESGVNENSLSAFMCNVLPQFFDSINLQEMVFVGPIYTSQDRKTPYIQLRRIIAETLVLKHAHLLEKLAIFGCDMNFVEDDNSRCVHKPNDLYYKPLSNKTMQPFSPILDDNSILRRCNVNVMMFSMVRHLVFEYELITTDALITLSKLDNLKVLSLNIVGRKGMKLKPVDWGEVTPLFNKGLEVTVNIISLPVSKFQNVMDNALCEGMPLTSLKVMFCQILSMRLICHVTQQYHSTLREFVWVDAPLSDKSMRLVRLHYGEDLGAPFNQVNPFIFLAWQCQQLKRLVVHGYWMCEYDLLGIIRLRKGVELDVSSVYNSTEQRFECKPQQAVGCVLRVLSHDTAPVHENKYKNAVGCVLRVLSHDTAPVHENKYKNIYTYREADGVRNCPLKPTPWHLLPRGLQPTSTPRQRADYIVQQAICNYQ